MLVYQSTDENSQNLWTKDVLISVRNLEQDIKSDPKYQVTCKANRVLGGTIDDVECDPNGFKSVLDIFTMQGIDLDDLDDLSESRLNQILEESVKDYTIWKEYSILFDN